jgi:CBS domain-containing protein
MSGRPPDAVVRTAANGTGQEDEGPGMPSPRARSVGLVKKQPITKVMSANVITVHRGQPLSEVWDILRENKIHHVPVVDGAKPVGIISATDILRLVYDFDGTDDRMLRTMLDHQFTIDDAMSTALVTANVNSTLHHAADLMSDGSIHSVLVLDDQGELAGIVTSTDIIRFVRDL